MFQFCHAAAELLAEKGCCGTDSQKVSNGLGQKDGKSLIGKVVCGGRTPALVKGYVEDPYLELPLNEKGKLDVAWAVGKDGNMTVIAPAEAVAAYRQKLEQAAAVLAAAPLR